MEVGQFGLLLIPALAGVAARLPVVGLAALNRGSADAPQVEIDVEVVSPKGAHSELRSESSLPMSAANRDGELREIARRLSV
jgi:hypothetical protein